MPTLVMLPRLVVVARAERKLHIWVWKPRGYRLSKTFPVTVGKIGARTPHGLYFVEGKSRRPDWRVPQSDDYAPTEWGKVYKFSTAGNPFAGGFISLKGKATGVGIHGTSFDPQIGTASSHGCIRMNVADILKVYDQLRVGTPVYIH